MQIFEAADPVWAAEHDFAAKTRDPAEMIGRVNALENIGGGRVDRRAGWVALEPLPGKTGGAVQQHVIKRQPAEAPAQRAKVFYVVP